MNKQQYSINESISKVLLDEIILALKTVKSYGSVEIYIQKGMVTQITVRKIKKTSAQQ